MKLFDLERLEDETGVSGTGIVAQGVEFDDGTIAMRWLTKLRSTSIYQNAKELEAIHGHNGKTIVRWRGRENTFDRAMLDATQDRYENCPFASIGGPSRRSSMSAPDYIHPAERNEYLRGYRHAAKVMYGDDWETCSFGWAPAITINGEP